MGAGAGGGYGALTKRSIRGRGRSAATKLEPAHAVDGGMPSQMSECFGRGAGVNNLKSDLGSFLFTLCRLSAVATMKWALYGCGVIAEHHANAVRMRALSPLPTSHPHPHFPTHTPEHGFPRAEYKRMLPLPHPPVSCVASPHNNTPPLPVHHHAHLSRPLITPHHHAPSSRPIITPHHHAQSSRPIMELADQAGERRPDR